MKAIRAILVLTLLVLHVRSSLAFEVPVNDMFANATVLTTEPSGTYFDLSSAGAEPGESFQGGTCWWNPSDNPERSVWFKFVPSHYGELTVNAPFHVMVEILKGTDLTTLEPVAGWSAGDRHGALVNEGEVYYIQLHNCSIDHMQIYFGHSFKSWPRPQTINFPPIADVPFSREGYILDASLSSGLPVEFRLIRGSATVTGNRLIPRAPGLIQIVAYHPGNGDHGPVESDLRTFTVLESAESLPRPVNDTSNNAIDLGSGSSVLAEGTTLGATVEAGEPANISRWGAVWYKWSPSVSGGVRYDIKLGTPEIWAYQPAGQDWLIVGMTNDTFFAQAGATYYFTVYPSGEPGPFRFSAGIDTVENDSFAKAKVVQSVNGVTEVNGDLFGATREPGEPEIPGATASVWYRWVPDFTGRAEYFFSQGGNGTIPKVAVYRASGNSFSDLFLISGANDRAWVIAGNTYYLSVYENSGPFRFVIQKWGPPPNDNFANAVPIELGMSILGNTSGATREAFEPYNEKGLNSIWYKWQPKVGAYLTVSVSLGEVTVFEAKGGTLQDLVPVAKGGQLPGESTYFSGGRTYYIAVYNNFGVSGYSYLYLTAPFYGIDEDNFATPRPLDFGANGIGTYVITLQGATLQPGEPAPPGSLGSRWYKVRVPYPAYLTARASEPNITFTVFTGTSLSDLVSLKPPLLYPDRDYYLSANALAESGAFELKISLTPAEEPFSENDNWENAQPLSLDATSVTGHFRQATVQPGEPEIKPGGFPPTERTLWWRLEPQKSGVLLLNAQSANFAGFAVYKGTSLANLERLTPTSYYTAALVTIDAGNIYYLQVQFAEFNAPTDAIRLRFVEGVANDNMENALPLDSGVNEGSLLAHNLGAGRQSGEPAFDSAVAGRTLWYAWVAPGDGHFRIGASGSTYLRVYRGSGLNDLTWIANRQPPFTEFVIDEVAVQAGERFLIQVDSAQDGSGLLTAGWAFRPPPQTPQNDSIANAKWLNSVRPSDLRATFDGVPVQSTGIGTELLGGPHRILWWKWYSPISGNLRLYLPFSSAGGGMLAAYDADRSFMLMQKGFDEINPAVMVGHTYYFAYVVPPAGNHDFTLAGLPMRSNEWTPLEAGNLVMNPRFDNLDPGAHWEFTGFPGTFGELAGSPAKLSQTISVEAGRLYSLGFTYFGTGPNYSVLKAFWDDSPLGTSVVTAGTTGDLHGTNYIIRARGNSAKISLQALAGPIGIGIVIVKPVQDSTDLREVQSIDFPPLPDVSAGGGSITLQANASSGLPVVFKVESGPALINGNTLTITGHGIIGIVASQPGSSSFFAAPEVRHSFRVFRQPQYIQFDSTPPTSASMTLSAISSSGLPITFSIIVGPGVVHGNILEFKGPGPVSVQAFQPGNELYEPGLSIETFTFARLEQTIDILVDGSGVAPAAVRKAAPMALSALASVTGQTFSVEAFASSGLPVTLAIVSGAAQLSGNLLTRTGSGPVILQATQPGDNLYSPVTKQYTLSPGKEQQTILFPTIPTVRWGSDPISLQASASSGLPVSFQLISGPATLVGSVLTINGPGMIHVKAVQEGDATFDPALSLEQTVQVLKGAQTISFPSISSVRFGGGPVSLQANASSGLPVSFQVVSGPATLVGNVLAISGTGSIQVRAVQQGDATFDPAPSIEQTVQVLSGLQTISFPNVPSVRFGGGPVPLQASASSGLPVSFQLVAGPATLLGNVLTMSGIGVIQIKAVQEGDATFEPAPSVEQTIQVLKGLQTILFEPPAGLVFGGAPVPLNLTSSSGLPVALEIISGKGKLAGNTLEINGAGGITIRAMQAGNDVFEAATPLERVIDVARASQTITFSEVPSVRLGGTSPEIQATASSGLGVTLEIDSGPAVLDVNTLKATGAGSVQIRAEQPGNSDFEPTAATLSIQIERALQTIVFIPPATMAPNDALELGATASSGLPVRFNVIAGPGEIVEGRILRAMASGTLVVEALQEGNATFEAVSVEAIITVTDRPELRISFENGAFILSAAGAEAFELQSSTNIAGPWIPEENPLDNATQINPAMTQKFYRLKLK